MLIHLLFLLTAQAFPPRPVPTENTIEGGKLVSAQGPATTAECALDADGDGFGDRTGRVASLDGDCDDPGEAAANIDCDDTSPTVFPGSVTVGCTEPPTDYDCDGTIDEPDSDGDGASDCGDADCAPSDPAVITCDTASDTDADTDADTDSPCVTVGGVTICNEEDAKAAFGCATVPRPSMLAVVGLLGILRRRRLPVAVTLAGCAQNPPDPGDGGCVIMVFPPTDITPGGPVQTPMGQLCWDADGQVQPWDWTDPAHGGGSVLRLYEGAVTDTSGSFQALPLDGTVVRDVETYHLDTCTVRLGPNMPLGCSLAFGADIATGGIGSHNLPDGTVLWDTQIWD